MRWHCLGFDLGATFFYSTFIYLDKFFQDQVWKKGIKVKVSVDSYSYSKVNLINEKNDQQKEATAEFLQDSADLTDNLINT